MKRKIALFLAVVMIAVMALPQIVMADSKKENPYLFPKMPAPYSAQMEDETSIRVSWRHMNCKAFVLSWKKSGSSENVQSVRIDTPEAVTYVVSGLEPKTDYDFTIKGVFTAADGSDLFTMSYGIEGATYVKTPVYGACQLKSAEISTSWHVKESYSSLNIYRSESRNGDYELIETIGPDGREYDEYDDRENYQYELLWSADCNAEAGKIYYYKAQTVGTIGGKTYKSEMSEAVALSAKNEEGCYDTKLMNKEKSYTKRLVIKVTSQEGNFTTYLKNFKNLVYRNSKGKVQNRKVVKAEYSRDGKKYYVLKNKNAPIKAGQSFYLRLTTKSRYWVSKSGKEGSVNLNVKYARPAYTGKSDNVTLQIREFNDTYGAYVSRDKGFNRDPNPFYDDFHNNDFDRLPSIVVEKVSASSVMLNWRGSDQVYAIRYGTTKKSVAPIQGSRILVPKYQVQLLINGLQKGKTYYFSFVPCTEDNEEQDEDNFAVKWDGKNTIPFRFKI